MDIWEKLQSVEQNLSAVEQKLRSTARAFHDPILIIDRLGKCLDVIGNGERSLYQSGKFFIDKYLHDVLPENLTDTFMQAISEAVADNSLKTVEYILDPAADIIGAPPDSPKGKQWFEARIYPLTVANNEITSVIWLPINITQKKELEEQVRELSERDLLTGAFNRNYFLQIFEKEFSISRRYRNRLTVLHIDIDNFKEINDAYGQDGGDAVLKRFTIFCEATLRDSDLFARYGGEAFIVMLPNTPSLGAAIIAERIRANAGELKVIHEKKTIQFTISIGISQALETDTNGNAVLARADSALYQAKKKGRNRIEIS